MFETFEGVQARGSAGHIRAAQIGEGTGETRELAEDGCTFEADDLIFHGDGWI